jgi:hypothetical protein
VTATAVQPDHVSLDLRVLPREGPSASDQR